MNLKVDSVYTFRKKKKTFVKTKPRKKNPTGLGKCHIMLFLETKSTNPGLCGKTKT